MVKSRQNHEYGIVIQDYFTKHLDVYPVVSKSALETKRAFQQYPGPDLKPKVVYSDGSGELIAAMKDMEILHDTATPHVPQTNGIAEGAVRRAKEGASAALVQSGLTFDWWPSIEPWPCC